MNNDFSDLMLLVDSREKEQSRINSMREFFESRGACSSVEAITIKDGNQITSMDYAIEGSYKGKEIKLGISAKSITDFSATIGNLPNELARGFLRFDEVGFILVTGCYTTTLSNDELHAVIKNPGASAHNQDDRADILNTTSMFNALSSWERTGIHCRQVLYEEAFPQAVMSILTFIAKDNHEGIGFNTKGVSDPIVKNKMNFVNAHVHLGVPGLGIQTALKLYNYMISRNNPANLHYVSSISEEELQDAIGQKTGKALYEVYRCMAGWPFKVDEDSQGCTQNGDKGKSKVNVQYANKTTPKEFVIGYLIKNPSGVKYNYLIGALKGAYPNSDVGELPDEFIDDLIKEGICYEPKLGLIVINPDYKQEKPFFSGDTAFLNDNKQVFTEVKPNKVDISKLSQVNKGKAKESLDHMDKASSLTGDSATSTNCGNSNDSREPQSYANGLNSHSPRSVDLGLQSSKHQSSVSHTEPSSSSAVQDLKVDDTLGDGMDKSPSGSKSQCDPAESEEFSNKFPIFTLSSPADDNYKLQLSSADPAEKAKKDATRPKLGTHNTFPVMDANRHTFIHDTAGNSVLIPPQLQPPAVSSIHHETVVSLEDAIVDRVWNKPESDEVLMREFTAKGYKIVEIHKTIKESTKLHKYHQGGIVMVSYIGVKEKAEMDIGV